MSSKFSAGGQAIGYLFQIRCALNLSLKEDNLDKDIAIEQLDDVQFEASGDIKEIIQTKHSINEKASLSDSSKEFWKTIRVWSELTKGKQIVPERIVLSLVTTSTAPENSIASYLRADNNRNVNEAHNKMINYISSSNSKEHIKNFAAFQSLEHEDQLKLLKSIQIIDNNLNILKVIESIKQKLKLAVRRSHLQAVFERLEGWWLNRVIQSMMMDDKQLISGFEIQDYINDLRDQMNKDSLPIDYRSLKKSDINVESDNRLFVDQLKIITLSNKRIEHAINDYYRAYTQRSRWIRDDLLFVGELEQYEERLAEEWERQFEMIMEEEFDNNDLMKVKKGKELYNKIQDMQLYIRKNCIEQYVMRGSFHILADKEEISIGWHPEFKDRLNKIIAERAKEIS
ncbi:ABC-three component system protein [Rossellomorea sp. GCM10028870]|uniref:ABC-three component system protein n=1 Tax=Rossellomorea sp. GCM10028870 TaxID=3273426 RepID=UPI003609F243